MFYIPYDEYVFRNDFKYISKKNEVEKFISQLLEAGFPAEYIVKGESGVTINTEGTIFTVENKDPRWYDKYTPGSGIQLIYGGIEIASTYECYEMRVSYLQINLHNNQLNRLPKQFLLNKEEELEVVKQAHACYLESLRNNPTTMREILNQVWSDRGYTDHHLEFKIKRSEDVLRLITGMQSQVRASKIREEFKEQIEFKIDRIGNELIKLVDNVLSIDNHNSCSDTKYALLRGLSNSIKDNEFKSLAELKEMSKAFIMLSLQRNQIGLTNTTNSGLLIKEFLNTKEYKGLREFLFQPEFYKEPIRYRDLRILTCGSNNESFFSSLNKNQMYGFFMTNMNKFGNCEKPAEKYEPEPSCFSF